MTDQAGCEFCGVAHDRAAGPPIASANDSFLVLIGRYQPTGAGYALVLPRSRVRDLHELADEDCGPMLAMVGRVSEAVQRAFGVNGTTIVQNNGRPGQSVIHLHFHVVPRHKGDGFLKKTDRAEAELELGRQAENLRRVLSDEET